MVKKYIVVHAYVQCLKYNNKAQKKIETEIKKQKRVTYEIIKKINF